MTTHRDARWYIVISMGSPLQYDQTHVFGTWETREEAQGQLNATLDRIEHYPYTAYGTIAQVGTGSHTPDELAAYAILGQVANLRTPKRRTARGEPSPTIRRDACGTDRERTAADGGELLPTRTAPARANNEVSGEDPLCIGTTTLHRLQQMDHESSALMRDTGSQPDRSLQSWSPLMAHYDYSAPIVLGAISLALPVAITLFASPHYGKVFAPIPVFVAAAYAFVVPLPRHGHASTDQLAHATAGGFVALLISEIVTWFAMQVAIPIGEGWEQRRDENRRRRFGLPATSTPAVES